MSETNAGVSARPSAAGSGPAKPAGVARANTAESAGWPLSHKGPSGGSDSVDVGDGRVQGSLAPQHLLKPPPSLSLRCLGC